jgi:hypothetical protein
MTTPDLSEKRREAARLRWIAHPFAKPGMMDGARKAFRLSFEKGHGCKACGHYIAVDQTLPDDQRRKAAERLRTRHYRNLARRSAATRRAQ